MSTWAWYQQLAILLFMCGTTLTSRIDDLVRRWSPLIWLAPGEKFLPDSIEDFLPHTQQGDYYGRMNEEQKIVEGDSSLYLHTVNNIDELLANETNSFLYGKDPSKTRVPTYAIVTKCPTQRSFHVTYWLFFPYNLGKEFCVLGNIPLPHIFPTCVGTKMFLGSHVGDYEHLSMSFTANSSYPQQIYLGTHESGVYYTLNRATRTFQYTEQIKRKFFSPKPHFPQTIRVKRKRIQVFAAKGSHGLWAEAGNHSYHKLLGIHDVNGFGTPWRTWEDLKIFHIDSESETVKKSDNSDNSVNDTEIGGEKEGKIEVKERTLPKWMLYEGRWGNPRSNCLIWRYFCAITDGPTGVLRPVKDFYCDKL